MAAFDARQQTSPMRTISANLKAGNVDAAVSHHEATRAPSREPAGDSRAASAASGKAKSRSALLKGLKSGNLQKAVAKMEQQEQALCIGRIEEAPGAMAWLSGRAPEAAPAQSAPRRFDNPVQPPAQRQRQRQETYEIPAAQRRAPAQRQAAFELPPAAYDDAVSNVGSELHEPPTFHIERARLKTRDMATKKPARPGGRKFADRSRMACSMKSGMLMKSAVSAFGAAAPAGNGNVSMPAGSSKMMDAVLEIERLQQQIADYEGTVGELSEALEASTTESDALMQRNVELQQEVTDAVEIIQNLQVGGKHHRHHHHRQPEQQEQYEPEGQQPSLWEQAAVPEPAEAPQYEPEGPCKRCRCTPCVCSAAVKARLSQHSVAGEYRGTVEDLERTMRNVRTKLAEAGIDDPDDAFVAFDQRDGTHPDGTITLPEWQQGLQALGVTFDAQEAKSSFQALDLDASGTIEQDEFNRAVYGIMPEQVVPRTPRGGHIDYSRSPPPKELPQSYSLGNALGGSAAIGDSVSIPEPPYATAGYSQGGGELGKAAAAGYAQNANAGGWKSMQQMTSQAAGAPLVSAVGAFKLAPPVSEAASDAGFF